MNAQPVDHPFTITALGSAHVDALLVLERSCYSLPWSRAMFLAELRREEGLRLGAWLQGELVAYLIVARYAEVWHVMNIATRSAARRQGAARALLDALFDSTCYDDERGYTLEVRVSNVAAIALYASYGFRPHGRRPGYYIDNREDALIMWKPPQSAPSGEWVPQA